MADKKGIFIEKLIYDIETSFGSMILFLKLDLMREKIILLEMYIIMNNF